MYASGAFSEYSGGVFSGCTSTSQDHAVTVREWDVGGLEAILQVVGYGTDSDSGVDYWLIKNSWSDSWGESGYIRLQRGVGMCGVGSEYVVVECESVAGATDATLTTEVRLILHQILFACITISFNFRNVFLGTL